MNYVEAQKSCIHFVRPRDILILEDMFAVLTPNGWVVPDWINLMWLTVRLRNEV